MYHVPRHPAYLYNLMDPSAESCLFLIISAVVEQVFFVIMWSFFFLFEFIAIGFSHSVSKCLEILSYHPHSHFPVNPTSQSDPVTAKLAKQKIKTITKYPTSHDITSNQLTFCLEMYDKLSLLVRSYNSLFAYLLFYLKAMILVMLCALIYVPLRFKIKQNTSISTLALLIFFGLAYSLTRRLVLLLNSMGNVYQKSLSFKASWVNHVFPFPRLAFPVAETDYAVFESAASILKRQNQLHKDLLQLCPPIRFKCAAFYDISPNTLLTFFSIMTTYLIVLLQI